MRKRVVELKIMYTCSGPVQDWDACIEEIRRRYEEVADAQDKVRERALGKAGVAS